MQENWRQEHGKSRAVEINRTNICYGAVVGFLALWIVWISTSVLIHFVQG